MVSVGLWVLVRGVRHIMKWRSYLCHFYATCNTLDYDDGKRTLTSGT